MQNPKNKFDCSFVRVNLFSYQEKRLSGIALSEFEDHIHSCRECSGILAGFQSVISHIDNKISVEPNPFIQTRIIQRLESMQQAEKEKSITFLLRVLRPVSVSIILIIAVLVGFSVVKRKEVTFSGSIKHQHNLQTMKSELNIPDFVDEKLPFSDNQ